jgi:hypothetical protein
LVLGSSSHCPIGISAIDAEVNGDVVVVGAGAGVAGVVVVGGVVGVVGVVVDVVWGTGVGAGTGAVAGARRNTQAFWSMSLISANTPYCGM